MTDEAYRGLQRPTEAYIERGDRYKWSPHGSHAAMYPRHAFKLFSAPRLIAKLVDVGIAVVMRCGPLN